jgi:hypothetical protein
MAPFFTGADTKLRVRRRYAACPSGRLPSSWQPFAGMTYTASLFRAKINSDYNDFMARVALEVVDS